MPSRKADTLIRMLDDEEHRWRAIEKLEVLSRLDGEANAAVTKLWEIVWNRNKEAPAPLNQRISALRAIGAINKTTSGLARDLFELIINPQTDFSLRVEAALQLGKLRKSARNI